MRHGLTILFLLFCFVMTTSMTCHMWRQKVGVDSMHYFRPKQVLIESDDYRDRAIELKLPGGIYHFTVDTTLKPRLFTAPKDEDEFYAIVGMIPEKFTDTSLIATLQYQSFQTKDLVSTSKFMKIRNYNLPFKKLRSFSVTLKDYGKAFGKSLSGR